MITPPEYTPEYDKDIKWDPNDIFQRKEFGEHLGNIIERSNGNLVIGLYAGWGEGKTTFVKTWTQHLEDRQFPVINIDAFETDYIDDPFGCLAGEAYEYIEKYCGSDNRITKLFAGRSNRVIKALASSAAGYFVPGGDKIAEALTSDMAYFGNSVQSYKEKKKELQDFKYALEIAAQRLGNSKPLIFIIDELDRCRPTYALQMLERIKHLFSVPNVVFVLVMNKQQMENSIKLAYGTNDQEAGIYLNKFIHLPVNLQMDESRLDKAGYARYFLNKMGYEPQDANAFGLDFYQHEYDSFSQSICNFIQYENITLREIQRILTLFMLAKNSVGTQNKVLFCELSLFFICYFKVMDFSLFQEITKYQDISKQIIEKISHFSTDAGWDLLEKTELKLFSGRNTKFEEGLEYDYSRTLSFPEIIEKHLHRNRQTPTQVLQYHLDLINLGTSNV
ncbi:KAP family P-loop NTPase fold protein [Terasakiella sp.]|uniref:KAP family P-loop NTPase fold protein n=1 Tax=Terasakiella sp. TaxID=2034861 RepID=UPI003AA854C5